MHSTKCEIIWLSDVLNSIDNVFNQQTPGLSRQLVLEKYHHFPESQQHSTNNPVCAILAVLTFNPLLLVINCGDKELTVVC